MSSRVSLQIEGVVEPLAAEGAEVSLGVAVALYVPVEQPLQREAFATHAARELVLGELARLVLGVVVVILELVSLTIYPQFEMRPGHFIFMQCHT